MPTHSLTRFKRAFGGSASPGLLAVRQEKIEAALRSVRTQIAQLTADGLDRGDLPARLAQVERRRDEALATKAAGKRSDALGVVKEEARKLADHAASFALGKRADGKKEWAAAQLEVDALRHQLVGTMQTARGHMELIHDAGLDASARASAYQALKVRLVAAGKIEDPRGQRDALAPLAVEAARLAAEVGESAPRLLGALAEQLHEARARVAGPVKTAEAVAAPRPKALQGALELVVDARDQAEGQANDEARRVALARIDLTALEEALGELAPPEEVGGEEESEEELEGSEEFDAAAEEALKRLRRVRGEFKIKRGEIEATGQSAVFSKRLKELGEVLAPLEKDDGGLFPTLGRVLAATEGLDLFKADVDAATEGVIDLTKIEALTKAIDPIIDRAAALLRALGPVADSRLLQETRDEYGRARWADPESSRIEQLAAFRDGALLGRLQEQSRALRDAECGLADLLAYIGTVIGGLEVGTKRTGYQSSLDLLVDQKTALLATPGMDLERVRAGFTKLRATATDLLKATSFKPKGDKAYKAALKGLYGIEVTSSSKLARVDVHATFDMLQKVPASHVGHEKLKTINFEGIDFSKGGDYAEGLINISMIPSIWSSSVQIGGKKVSLNHFNFTMLHELGHAVDDRYHIMNGPAKGVGYGDWQAKSAVEMAVFFVGAAREALGAAPSERALAEVEGLIDEAMKGTQRKRPSGLTDPEWKVLRDLTQLVIKCRADKQPWFKAKPEDVQLGGRVYSEATPGGSWNSYLLAERARTYVSDYQWKAPAEWFAELYGASWLADQKPPPGVGPKVAEFCFGGDAAQDEQPGGGHVGL